MRAAIVIYAGTETGGDRARLLNGLETANEFAESVGDSVKLLFEGAGTKWVPELERPAHEFHPQYRAVEDVAVYGTENPDERRVLVGLSLETIDAGDRERPLFGDTPLRRGAELEVPTAGYDLSGTVERVGATTQRGSPAIRTVTLEMRNVREPVAGAVRPGLTERAGGETVARVRNVTVEPSILVLAGEDGSLGVFEHPVERDVTITATLRVRETATGVRFKGETIRQGRTVTLDTGTVTITATVVSIGPRVADGSANMGGSTNPEDRDDPDGRDDSDGSEPAGSQP